MPYLNIKLCAPESAETSDRVAALLTDLTAEVLGKKRSLTSVAVDYVAAEHWYVGGQAMASQQATTFYLDIKITEGTNTKDQKAAYVADVFAGLEAMLGALHGASYIVIHEVPADAWGYEGRTQEFRYVQGKAL